MKLTTFFSPIGELGRYQSKWFAIDLYKVIKNFQVIFVRIWDFVVLLNLH